jgi:hypothetical protein
MRQKNQVDLNLDTGARGGSPGRIFQYDARARSIEGRGWIRSIPLESVILPSQYWRLLDPAIEVQRNSPDGIGVDA